MLCYGSTLSWFVMRFREVTLRALDPYLPDPQHAQKEILGPEVEESGPEPLPGPSTPAGKDDASESYSYSYSEEEER